MRPGTDSDANDGVVGVGIALLSEGLEVTVAMLIDVVNDPGLLRLPAGTFPGALAYRHDQSPQLSKKREYSPTGANAGGRQQRDMEHISSVKSIDKCIFQPRPYKPTRRLTARTRSNTMFLRNGWY